MAQSHREEQLQKELFQENTEKLLCVAGTPQFDRYMEKGKRGKCFAVLSDRAIYCKGKCSFSKDRRSYQTKQTDPDRSGGISRSEISAEEKSASADSRLYFPAAGAAGLAAGQSDGLRCKIRPFPHPGRRAPSAAGLRILYAVHHSQKNAAGAGPHQRQHRPGSARHSREGRKAADPVSPGLPQRTFLNRRIKAENTAFVFSAFFARNVSLGRFRQRKSSIRSDGALCWHDLVSHTGIRSSFAGKKRPGGAFQAKKKLHPFGRSFVLALSIFTYSHPYTIVDEPELNFCVRDGNRWTLRPINTNFSGSYPEN